MTNVTIIEDSVNLVDAKVKHLSVIHIVLNNAGAGGGGRDNPFKISAEDFAWRFHQNVFSARRLSQLCILHNGGGTQTFD